MKKKSKIKRMNISLPIETYEKLRLKAFKERTSMSAIIRNLIKGKI